MITGGGNLKARHVIHAVGPAQGRRGRGGKTQERDTEQPESRRRERPESIGFPAISTGVFGFPIEHCAEIMLSATIAYLQGETGLEKVVYCLYGQEAFGVFDEVLKKFE